MSDLTLPGTIPGLLRMCSPVVTPECRRGVVVEPGSVDNGLPGYFYVASGGEGGSRLLALDGHPAANLALDLTNLTGRLHAAIWLAEAAWKLRGVRSAAVFQRPDESYWMLVVHERGQTCREIDGLDTIDCLDGSRLLPDGSRWIEAEALRRGCVYAAESLRA